MKLITDNLYLRTSALLTKSTSGRGMALCDALKVRISDTQTTQSHLADAIVEQAIA